MATTEPSVAQAAQEKSELWDLATRMTNIQRPYAVEVTKWLYEKLPELPRDDEFRKSLEDHAHASAREVFVTLRAGMSPEAHEAPAEGIAHARFLRGRGIGFATMVGIYKPGYAVFRNLAILEFEALADDPSQARAMTEAIDAYAFPFISTTLSRLAIEFGVLDEGWVPTSDDPVLADPEARREAERIRDEYQRKGEWVAETAEDAQARRDAEATLNSFVDHFEAATREGTMSERLRLAGTRTAITLADEPELSITLLLDRDPVEVLEGEHDWDSRLWISSVDLARIGSRDFHLPMAIAKGRARCAGAIRGFLRVAPILNGLFEGTDFDATPEKTQGGGDGAIQSPF